MTSYLPIIHKEKILRQILRYITNGSKKTNKNEKPPLISWSVVTQGTLVRVTSQESILPKTRSKLTRMRNHRLFLGPFFVSFRCDWPLRRHAYECAWVCYRRAFSSQLSTPCNGALHCYRLYDITTKRSNTLTVVVVPRLFLIAAHFRISCNIFTHFWLYFDSKKCFQMGFHAYRKLIIIKNCLIVSIY